MVHIRSNHETRVADGAIAASIGSHKARLPHAIKSLPVAKIERQLTPSSNAEEITPFLKWAGGKRWLVEQHPWLFEQPKNRLIEPFLGSGAVFFKMRPERALLSDRNAALIETYDALANDWKSIAQLLKLHQRRHSTEYYYKMRSSKLRTPCARAAQFIYLNRTCWNGLYRVNRTGAFNVPIGTKQNVLLDSDDFARVSNALSGASLVADDFVSSLESASTGDFVFVDPPYTVRHNTNGFVKYNEALFTWADQIRLRDHVRRAIKRGAKVLVTNAAHECITELYRGIGQHIRLRRPSLISGITAGRGIYDELIIKCY